MRLGPHLHRIGNDIVAAYLVDTDAGVTVVDAGLPGQWHDLTAELAGMGRSRADVRGVVLTHGDTDHIGFAERLRRERGVSRCRVTRPAASPSTRPRPTRCSSATG